MAGAVAVILNLIIPAEVEERGDVVEEQGDLERHDLSTDHDPEKEKSVHGTGNI